MVRQIIDYLAEHDPETANAIKKELVREERGLELIASENLVSEAVMLAAANPKLVVVNISGNRR